MVGYQDKLSANFLSAIDGRARLSDAAYHRELARLQLEMVKLQDWVHRTGEKLVVIFAGPDATYRTGIVEHMTRPLNPRICRIVALPAPNDRQKTQWHFQRHVPHLPAAGEIVLFSRAWYDRDWLDDGPAFLRSCAEFERMLISSGIRLVKYRLTLRDPDLETRLDDGVTEPSDSWEADPERADPRPGPDEDTADRDTPPAGITFDLAPWHDVDTSIRRHARLSCIAHLLSLIPYESVTPPPFEPAGQDGGPAHDRDFVPVFFS